MFGLHNSGHINHAWTCAIRHKKGDNMITLRKVVGAIGLPLLGYGLYTLGPAFTQSIFKSTGRLDWLVGVIAFFMFAFSLMALVVMIIGDKENLFAYFAAVAWLIILAIIISAGLYNPMVKITMTPIEISSGICGLIVVPAIVFEDLRNGWN